ncbi:MAG TPA: Uma2 family endonuclease [Isosphaeraceae bacterium]|nr:Uma2 family endonuclease [Isosphaeraceae bacterium]
MSTDAKTFLTPEQYLEIERKAEFKSEYYQGKMFRMDRDMVAVADVKENHNLLVVNLVAALHPQLRAGPCRLFAHDMGVRVSAPEPHVCPDVIAVYGERQFLDDQKETLLNPTLIVEVIAPSTEAYDRGRKFHLYQSIESSTEYLLVSSDRLNVDLYTRLPGGGWLLTSADRLEDVLDLQSVGCRLLLADLYENVELEK